ARDRTQAPAPGRPHRRHEPAGDAGLHRLRLAPPQRARADRADDRTRHAGRHGRLRPRDGARLRREDRRGHAAGSAEGRACDRGLPRNEGDPLKTDGKTKETNGFILELDDVHTYYGAIHALKGISIQVAEREIVTLIGANGAGKSTTLRSINGLQHPSKGTIRFQGKEITTSPAHTIVRLGIAQSPEGRKLFPRMTVSENLDMGAFQRRDKSNFKEDLDRVYSLFP